MATHGQESSGSSPTADEHADRDDDGGRDDDAGRDAGTHRKTGGPATGEAAVPETPTAIAQELLVACKRGTDPAPYERALANLDDDELLRVRNERDHALAFWINCYNAGTQLLLDRRPGLYESPLRFVRFFYAPAVTVAGTALPLDRIENGLLRSGRTKYGLGYLPKLLVSSFERRYVLETCDPRIHFALNCGAESCPAIRAYDPGRIDAQLDRATRAYLDGTVTYDPDAGVVRVPRVMLWFRGDFGGGSGIRAFLREYDAVPADASPTVRYRAWDWSRDAGAFADSP